MKAVTKPTAKDVLIDELIQIAQNKKKEIEKAEKPTWLTNCLFSYDNSSMKTNIRTVSSIRELVNILAFVINKDISFSTANSFLGTKEVFEYFGFTKEDWINDIKTRIDQINITAKRKELEGIESKLDSMISKERREELELEAIVKQLKG